MTIFQDRPCNKRERPLPKKTLHTGNDLPRTNEDVQKTEHYLNDWQHKNTILGVTTTTNFVPKL